MARNKHDENRRKLACLNHFPLFTYMHYAVTRNEHNVITENMSRKSCCILDLDHTTICVVLGGFFFMIFG